MGFFRTVLGFFGFGVGVTMGLVIGYYLFIYFQPTDVKVRFATLLFVGCLVVVWHRGELVELEARNGMVFEASLYEMIQ